MQTIVLASSSPRRIDLMGQVGLSVKVLSPNVDETRRPGENPGRLVARLAREKADSVAPRVISRFGSGLIVAADTIVVAPNGRAVLGKPTNPAEACRMLRALAGKTHTVFTGYCVLGAEPRRPARRLVRVVRTRVTMRPLSKSEISRYVATREPMDKAGAYAAQGLGMALIREIRGSYTNVVGLPIFQLLDDFQKAFDIPLFSWL